MSRWVPLLIFAAIVAGLVWRLSTPEDSRVASRLEGQQVPGFVLGPAVNSNPALSSADLATGTPHLVNIFASWCVPCVSEVKVLQTLAQKGVPIDGIAIRDRPDDVAAFLARYGDPYQRIGSDDRSQVQIALGSSGVPESFIVDGRGIIRYQHIGPIEQSDVPTILAEMERAR